MWEGNTHWCGYEEQKTNWGVIPAASMSGDMSCSVPLWECAGSVQGGSFKEDMNKRGSLRMVSIVEFDTWVQIPVPFTSSGTLGR